MHLLIGYDGSPGAGVAIDEAARLFPGAHATVLTCWSSAGAAAGAGRLALSEAMIAQAVERLDAASRAQAAAVAEAGAQRARAAGLDAGPAEHCTSGATWGAVLARADEEDADVIVVGSRGRSDITSLVLGSTSHGVAQHSRRTVVVVPRGVPGGPAAGRQHAAAAP